MLATDQIYIISMENGIFPRLIEIVLIENKRPL